MTDAGARQLASAPGPEAFPRPELPEIALLGRSNVGKSSLLNRLAGRKALAATSGRPGRTRRIDFYRVERPGGAVCLVDLPGYGFAHVSKRERARWQPLVEGYLEERATLRAAVLLQDLRRPISEDETLLLAWLEERRIPALVAATKSDRERPARRAARLAALAEGTGLPRERVLATSARTGAGLRELWRALDALA